MIPDVVFFVDRRCFPNWEIIKQTIDFHDLTFVVEGKSNYYVNGVKHTVEAGDVVYIPVGSVREAHTFKENPAHSYAFNFKWLPNENTEPLPLQTVTKNVITNELQVLVYVAEHYAEELDLAGMAEIVGLHPVYLGKLFKKNMGYSFKEHLNMIRINHAEMLLSTGGFSVTQVAERCGFRDISYFSNVFKSVKGYPPSTVFKCQSG